MDESVIVDHIEINEFYTNLFSDGVQRIWERKQEMLARGILDNDGKLLDTSLPEDMRDDSSEYSSPNLPPHLS